MPNIFNESRFIFYQLLRPFSYLQIQHRDRHIYNWIVPLVASILTMIFILVFIDIKDAVREGGLIDSINNFVANLPGFFIAALAAVATFNKNDIDLEMNNDVKLTILYQGSSTDIPLTRRRFLCVLFSYLTATSLFLVLFTKLALASSWHESWYPAVSWIGCWLFFFILWQMLLATVLGLYYLGERLHTAE
ncbi:hypothetical protein ACJ5NB_002408 [Vibrio alginolyticus]|uniref:hypothetical protein n=1 Tax=Vibrio diabolicus TaxID=50719 RepID=UPI0035C777B7